jgi:hypothetical protein
VRGKSGRGFWGLDRSIAQNASMADRSPKRKRVESVPLAGASGYSAQHSDQGRFWWAGALSDCWDCVDLGIGVTSTAKDKVMSRVADASPRDDGCQAVVIPDSTSLAVVNGFLRPEEYRTESLAN